MKQAQDYITHKFDYIVSYMHFVLPAEIVAQACSCWPFLIRMGGTGGAKDGDNSGNRAFPIRPTNCTDPKATALTKVELSLTNLNKQTKTKQNKKNIKIVR